MKNKLILFSLIQLISLSVLAQFTSDETQNGDIEYADCQGAKVIFNKPDAQYRITYSVNGEERTAFTCSVREVKRGITPDRIIKCYDIDAGDTLVFEVNSIGLKTLTLNSVNSGNQKVTCK